MSKGRKTIVKVTMRSAATKNYPSYSTVENLISLDESCTEYSSEMMGYIEQYRNRNYVAVAVVNGDDIDAGEHVTRRQAKRAVKVAYFKHKGEDNTCSIVEAALVLSPKAKDPVSALKKKIARGSVETVNVNGEIRVVMPRT